MAIRLVLGIVNAQGYKLDVYEYSEPGTDVLRFNLHNKNKENESPILECDTLYEVISYIQENAKNRINSAFLSLMNTSVINNILSAITAPVYTDYVATGFGNNKDVINEKIEV